MLKLIIDQFFLHFRLRAIKIQSFLKWVGLIFGSIGILISGTLFFLIMKSMPMRPIPSAPSSGTKIDVQSIENDSVPVNNGTK